MCTPILYPNPSTAMGYRMLFEKHKMLFGRLPHVFFTIHGSRQGRFLSIPDALEMTRLGVAI